MFRSAIPIRSSAGLPHGCAEIYFSYALTPVKSNNHLQRLFVFRYRPVLGVTGLSRHSFFRWMTPRARYLATRGCAVNTIMLFFEAKAPFCPVTSTFSFLSGSADGDKQAGTFRVIDNARRSGRVERIPRSHCTDFVDFWQARSSYRLRFRSIVRETNAPFSTRSETRAGDLQEPQLMPQRSSEIKEPRKEPRVTLKILAEHLHLTAGTISAALNDSAAARAIPEHTKRRILEAARELNYKPNYFARSCACSAPIRSA